MSFRDVGAVADEMRMFERAWADAAGFVGLLRESKNPGKEAHDFCAKVREISSLQNKTAVKRWGANSSDYIRMAGWMKFMANWLERCQAFSNLLGMDAQDEACLTGAAPLIGLLHTFSQTISLALPELQDEAV